MMYIGNCMFGTIDSWLIWNLTGGINGGKHVTDCTNASRTMLMNIDTLKWDPVLLNFFNLPESMLPSIKSSSEVYGKIADGPLAGVPISGCLGDQQAALVGQMCLGRGEVIHFICICSVYSINSMTIFDILSRSEQFGGQGK